MTQVIVEDDILFKECIDVLGEDVTILSKEESHALWALFKLNTPIIRGGSRIDWNQVERKTMLNTKDQIVYALELLLQESVDLTVYVLWNDASLPIIKTNILSILNCIDDVTCVGFETWLYNPWQRYIIEFYYLGDITVGILPIQNQSHS